jgi:hypothetical protein
MVIGAGSAFEVSNKGTLKRLPDVTVEKGSTFIIGNIINKDTREPLRDLPLFLCRIIDSGKDKKQIMVYGLVYTNEKGVFGFGYIPEGSYFIDQGDKPFQGENMKNLDKSIKFITVGKSTSMMSVIDLGKIDYIK